MCGRYSLHAHPDVVALQFGLSRRRSSSRVTTSPRPRQRPSCASARSSSANWRCCAGADPVLVEGRGDRRAPDQRACRNGRRKPAFRSAFARRRCLVPADGYYEWKARRPSSLTCCCSRPASPSPWRACGSSGARPRAMSPKPMPSSPRKPRARPGGYTAACR